MSDLTPDDIAALKLLAGASFLGGTGKHVTLPSGKRLTRDEAQALTAAYAPNLGHPRDEPKTGRRQRPVRDDDPSPSERYAASGFGTPCGPTAALLAEADRGWRRRQHSSSTEAPAITRRDLTFLATLGGSVVLGAGLAMSIVVIAATYGSNVLTVGVVMVSFAVTGVLGAVVDRKLRATR